MRLSPVWIATCVFVLVVVGCDRARPESAPPVAVASGEPAAAAAPSNATGDEPERLCGAKSSCPAEVVDDEGTKLCASLAREPICGAKFLALVKCQIAKEKCGADGKTDQVATLELCKLEETALNDCDRAKAAATPSSAK